MSYSPREWRLISILLAGALLGAPALDAQSTRLVGPFPSEPGGGDVLGLLVSPDGTRVVYRGDEESYGVFELFSAPADGSAAPKKLNGTMNDSGEVLEHGFAITPDGTRVVYAADQESNDRFELYGVPLDGSLSPVKLSGPMNGSGVRSFAISADGSRVVYAADQTTWHKIELYSAPVDGSSSSVRLSGTLPAFASVNPSFQLGAGSRAVYAVDAPVDGRDELFSVPLDGSLAPVQLTHVPASSRVSEFELTTDGTAAVFVHRQSSPTVDYQLSCVPIDGSAGALALTTAPIAFLESFRVSPGGTHAVYRAYLSTPGVYELFSVPLDGSASPARLNPVFSSNRTVLHGQYDISADSARVLYVADQAADEVFELWSAPLDGSASALKLNGALVSGGDVACVAGVSSVSAGQRIVYVADQDTDGVRELYSVPADGSAGALKLNGPLTSAAIQTYSTDPLVPTVPFGTDHTRAVFALDVVVGVATHTELYSVPVDASASPAKLNGVLVPGGSVVTSNGWGFAGSRAVYVADQDTDEVRELYSTPLDGGPGRVKLNEAMAPTPPGVSVDVSFEITSGPAARAVYLLQQNEGWDLASVPVDGKGSPLVLASGLPPYNLSLAVTADGARAVYSEWAGVGSNRNLYSVPVDGSASALLLLSASHPLAPGLTPDGAYSVQRTGDQRLLRVTVDGSSAPLYLSTAPASPNQLILDYQFSAIGGRVVFRQDRDVAGRYELFSVPLDGSSLPLKLNSVLPALGDVASFRISPDGSWVVYTADQEVDFRDELYAVPITGGVAQKLNGALASGGSVTAFKLSPDGARALYVADHAVDERYELFSVALTGGAAVKLNGTLVSGGDVSWWPDGRDFDFSPDGTRVVYLADQDVDDRLELYGVPAAGGAVVKLNGPLAPGERVDQALLSADSRFVVFHAGSMADQRFELFSRRVDGSGVPTKLNAALPIGGSVGVAALHSGGRGVVYRADQRTDEVQELFTVPIEGGLPVRLNGPLVTRGDVVHFALDLSGRRVVYLADQDTDAVYELYSSPLQPRIRAQQR